MEQAANNKAPIDNGVIRLVDLRNEEYDRYDPITSDLGKKTYLTHLPLIRPVDGSSPKKSNLPNKIFKLTEKNLSLIHI